MVCSISYPSSSEVFALRHVGPITVHGANIRQMDNDFSAYLAVSEAAQPVKFSVFKFLGLPVPGLSPVKPLHHLR
jgi:hypothetical protein